MANPMDLADLQPQSEPRALSRDDAPMLAKVIQQQVLRLTNNAGGTVTREQLAQALAQQAADEVLHDELSVASWNRRAPMRAMVDIMMNDGDDDSDSEDEDDEEDGDSEDDEEDDEDEDDDSNGLDETVPSGDPLSPPESSQFTDTNLEGDGDQDTVDADADSQTLGRLSSKHGGRDLITGLCMRVELAVELGKHLRPEDILNLYIANRAFNNAVTGHLLSCIRMWIAHRAPEAGEVFKFNFYRKLLVFDPAGRTWDEQYDENEMDMLPEGFHPVRFIPGLKYLQLVLGRSRYCSEITAILARNGHRTPPTMHGTLMRMWQLMELPTTAQRTAWLQRKGLWSDFDLYNAQLLFIKLGMHFNDPIYGPQTNELLHLILGKKGLFPLWQLLMRKRFTTMSELLELHARYDMCIPERHQGSITPTTVWHGVPVDELGRGHLEGWGYGKKHLMRPDELIPVEAVARGLELERHLPHMVTWGHIDPMTGQNLVPSEEEMYISDDERALAHMDTTHHWRRKHVLKARWDDLTETQRQEIQREDEDELLRAQAWCSSGIDEDDDDTDDEACWDEVDEDANYHPEDEINRGYIIPPQPKSKRGQTSVVPPKEDRDSWNSYMKGLRVGLPPVLTEDEVLRALPDEMESHERFASHWFDWPEWLKTKREQEASKGEESDDYSESSSVTSGSDEPNIDDASLPGNSEDDEASEEDDDDVEGSEMDEDSDGGYGLTSSSEDSYGLTSSVIERIERGVSRELEELDARGREQRDREVAAMMEVYEDYPDLDE